MIVPNRIHPEPHHVPTPFHQRLISVLTWIQRGAAEPQEELGFPAKRIVNALTDLATLVVS